MSSLARQKSIRLFRTWLIGLGALLFLGVGSNVVLARRVDYWRSINPHLHWTRAEKLIYDQDYATAFKEVLRAIELAPNRFEPYFVGGHLFYARKEWDKALQMYQKAEQFNKDNRLIRERVFWCLMNAKRYREAAEYASERILPTQIFSKDIPKYVAHAWVQVGEMNNAVQILEAELQKSPDDTDLMIRLINIYRQTGQNTKADKLSTQLNEIQARTEQLFPLP